MTTLIFPIYESYFFVMLYDVMQDDSSDSIKNTAKNVLNLYIQLGNYLSSDNVIGAIDYKNYQAIIMEIGNDNPSSKKKAKKTQLKPSDFIVSNYSDTDIDLDIFKKISLSTHNHMPKPKPALISRQYLYENYSRSAECFLTSCVAQILKK